MASSQDPCLLVPQGARWGLCPLPIPSLPVFEILPVLVPVCAPQSRAQGCAREFCCKIRFAQPVRASPVPRVVRKKEKTRNSHPIKRQPPANFATSRPPSTERRCRGPAWPGSLCTTRHTTPRNSGGRPPADARNETPNSNHDGQNRGRFLPRPCAANDAACGRGACNCRPPAADGKRDMGMLWTSRWRRRGPGGEVRAARVLGAWCPAEAPLTPPRRAP